MSKAGIKAQELLKRQEADPGLWPFKILVRNAETPEYFRSLGDVKCRLHNHLEDLKPWCIKYNKASLEGLGSMQQEIDAALTDERFTVKTFSVEVDDRTGIRYTVSIWDRRP